MRAIAVWPACRRVLLAVADEGVQMLIGRAQAPCLLLIPAVLAGSARRRRSSVSAALASAQENRWSSGSAPLCWRGPGCALGRGDPCQRALRAGESHDPGIRDATAAT
jgi:hypothetical protein